MRGDRRLTVQMMASLLNMKKDSVWKIDTKDLGICKNGAMAVQKEYRMQLCQDINERLQNEPDLLRRVITGEETWVFEYDPETKYQSSSSNKTFLWT